MQAKELRMFRTQAGREPFVEWIEQLKDRAGRSHIMNRLNRVALGSKGDSKVIDGGIYELRIHYGPGYRVYFTEQDETIVLLLGGTKRTQYRDIKKAKLYWVEFRSRHYD